MVGWVAPRSQLDVVWGMDDAMEVQLVMSDSLYHGLRPVSFELWWGVTPKNRPDGPTANQPNIEIYATIGPSGHRAPPGPHPRGPTFIVAYARLFEAYVGELQDIGAETKRDDVDQHGPYRSQYPTYRYRSL
jgi:hypothetical protein